LEIVTGEMLRSDYIQLYFIANDSKKKRIIIRATHRNNNKINVIVNDTPASVVVSMNIV